MFKNVALLFYGLFNVDGDDGQSQGPGGEVEDHGLIVVEQHGGNAISTGETESMMKEGRGLFDQPAKLGIGVAAIDVPLVIVIREEWSIGYGGMMHAGTEEFGKGGPRERPRGTFHLSGLLNAVMHVDQWRHRFVVMGPYTGLVDESDGCGPAVRSHARTILRCASTRTPAYRDRVECPSGDRPRRYRNPG